jgi:hypothetical protein
VRFLVRNQLLTVFLVLCVLGMVVGAQTRPDPAMVPWDELFREMRVTSYRDSPSDTVARFVVDLAAGGRVFRRYDIDNRTFLPPPRGRDYDSGITATHYRPLELRGHVANGMWLDVPRHSGLALLPDQFRELYRATMDHVKPVSLVTGVLGTLSGYSVGYRLGAWNSTLRSRAVQQRVLATPGLGRALTREAWRRVLLEPVIMGGEEDASRFARIRSSQRVYATFLGIAMRDSDNFIPREAARLTRLGRTGESLAMLHFAHAVRRAADDRADLNSADFSAVERWASLIARRGHWAWNALPADREERAQYLGMLTWYGVAPQPPGTDRVWVGPRVLVREGEVEGFVADDIAAAPVACPVAWRAMVAQQKTGTDAIASAWLTDHPEFTALARIVRRFSAAASEAGRAVAARPHPPAPPAAQARRAPPAIPVAFDNGITVTALTVRGDSTAVRDTLQLIRGPDAAVSPADSTLDSLRTSATPESLEAGATGQR